MRKEFSKQRDTKIVPGVDYEEILPKFVKVPQLPSDYKSAILPPSTTWSIGGPIFSHFRVATWLINLSLVLLSSFGSMHLDPPVKTSF